MKAFVPCLLMLFLTSSVNILAQKPEWQGGIDWAATDTGAPDCDWMYTSVLQNCLVGGWLTGNNAGNRSCATSIAIEAAYRNYDGVALWIMADVCQCHNDDAAQKLYDAGPQAVGEYLRTAYQRPAWSVGIDLAGLVAH